jgi:protein-tyrosine-phosphatase
VREILAGIVGGVVVGVCVALILKAMGVGGPRLLDWVRSRLRLPRPRRDRLLIFLSDGGTCRDPMAKVITEKALERESLPFRVRVEARSLTVPGETQASFGARCAIADMFCGPDLLAKHVPTLVSDQELRTAELVLAMDHGIYRQVRASHPGSRTFEFKAFFGLSGEIADPVFGDVDEYKRCAEEMKAIIEGNIDRLVEALATPSTELRAREPVRHVSRRATRHVRPPV